jgi:probable phosphoglycerate mutase
MYYYLKHGYIMTKYYFVRHGESMANASGILAGSLDFLLTGNGIKQATEAADKIVKSGIEFDSIISSPLLRAYCTAQIIAEIIGFKKEHIRIVDSLRGGSGGDLEGLPYKYWYATPEEEIAKLHGAEDAEMLRKRIGQAITRVAELTIDDENTLIVAHAVVYQMLRAIHANVEPATEAYKIAYANNGEFVEIDI